MEEDNSKHNKNSVRSLREHVDENPCGIVLNAPRTRQPKVFIKTFGCQMNTRDSELVAGVLLKAGYQLAENIESADIVLFNTCSVRQHAEDKVWSEIGCYGRCFKPQAAGRRKKHGACSLEPVARSPVIGLLGCMAENYKKAAFAKSALVDVVVGPNDIGSIADVLDEFFKRHIPQMAVGRKQRIDAVYDTDYVADKNHANVIIMEGCDNFCSYCIVPYVRGRERSRPAHEIIREIEGLVRKGVKEVTLLGQNVNSYTAHSSWLMAHGRKKIDFIDLLKMVNEVEGLEKFDFVTSHPKDASEELFRVMRELPRCKKFLHLPVQSGSDRILKLMNRGYTREHYIKLVKKAKEIIPGLRLTTDVLVGFPGETEADFQDTFDLMKEVEFSAAYIFKYSPRPRTKAAGLADDVPQPVKKERNQKLLEFQKSLHKKKSMYICQDGR
ncbi:MAG: tRNA (N6-isopentenyl adenosine(37)-C2)-methylthiotransferase MiaB [Candidatus Omnitrophica bacterium]|nr:tRNA (N6-isopentenyl adenosine(37)-C2)-methylthiotransferase MiaB [Candidatus Omnitrophota bacterium]